MQYIQTRHSLTIININNIHRDSSKTKNFNNNDFTNTCSYIFPLTYMFVYEPIVSASLSYSVSSLSSCIVANGCGCWVCVLRF